MERVVQGIIDGLKMFFGGDPVLWEIILLSAKVSGIALVFSAVLGIPIGAFLGLVRFRGRRLVQAFVYTGMGLPPVVAGLAVYLLLSRAGILGPLNLPFIPQLFTVSAMILAQVIIATPMIVGYTMSAVAEVAPDLRLQVRSLGATPFQVTVAVLREARMGLIVALVGGLGSIISEVGAVMMVGGNIEGKTRVLTTAIMLETRQGDFSLAIGLGMVLLALSFAINYGVTQLQGKGN
ncbi:ABC-type tungstate transport system, periplasmic component [Longilinea arvoryzae]|uniref:ABC-type tungstate transport system, periplasmic component n=1 Tax=Longilinea arvoryzae TaxID=360412 RepID=A0A0S7BFV0_9CHLR|nr:ABC transporter permease [Longilinea arvoryzae]GAP12581.1 ABC-type tungstate transport system, periplasmic component [Longilinea arvoryzae]